jgi:hypothetical protein
VLADRARRPLLTACIATGAAGSRGLCVRRSANSRVSSRSAKRHAIAREGLLTGGSASARRAQGSGAHRRSTCSPSRPSSSGLSPRPSSRA